MPKLFSSKQVERALLKHDFYLTSQKGSHIKYRKDGTPTFTVIVPAGRKELPLGTLRSILRQSGLKEDDLT